MKKLTVLLVITASAAILLGACQATRLVPNLVGTWDEQRETISKHSKNRGFEIMMDESPPFIIIIKEQQNRAFVAEKQWVKRGKAYSEEFSCTISSENRLNCADHDKGYSFGRILSDDRMEIDYVEDGEKAKVIRVEVTKRGS
jgi:hypothetical protein